MISHARYSNCALAAAATAAWLVSHAAEARADDAAARQYVELALAHQTHGKAEVARHLLEAALVESPEYAPAHWHLGHVQIDGRWVPAAEAHKAAGPSETLLTYQKLREEALDDPRREMSLAKWCRRQGWREHEELHYSRVALNSAADERHRAEAMRKLDLVNANGTLLSNEELASIQEQAERVEAAMKKWRGPLEEWALAIVGEDEAKAALAAEELAKVDDPDVVPVVESFLLESGPVFGKHLAALLGRFPQVQSTESLARFAVLSPWEYVRDQAIKQLKTRPLHEFVPLLLDTLVAPIQSRLFISINELGWVRSQHLFFRQNADASYLIARDHIADTAIRRITPSPRRTTENITEADAVREAQARTELDAARAMVRALKRDEEIERLNAPILAMNERILAALEQVTGERIGPNPADWQLWWRDYNETAKPKPTYYAYYPTHTTYVASYMPIYVPPPPCSCFSAGTLVWTETGLVPIESVMLGDRVLSQDLDSGELTYKVVVRTTAGPPTSETASVTVDSESVCMTTGHVAWVDGKGWRMAKELKPGNFLHGVGGPMEVRSVDELPPELEVYNLVVADNNTFFVGESGVLVHDITYVTRRRPTTAVVPGFAPGGPRAAGNPLTSPGVSLVRQVINGWRQ